ncbi:ABC transporter substrate-binding protein [Kiritimatiellota bacterium B12222]|nr:ABC transporter substrate-binding protein [Kiritimatiellota bacterium B12222]
MKYYILFYMHLTTVLANLSASDRLISLGSPVTETIIALGAANALVGIDDSSQQPQETSPLPTVGYYRMLSAEGVLSLRPSLILSTEDAGPPAAIQKIKRTQIPFITLTSEKSLEAAVKRFQVIGEALNKQAEADILAQPLLERIAHPLPPLDPAPHVLFIYARGSGAPNVSGSGTAADEMIRLAGATNAVTEFNGYRPLTPEALVTASPTVILMTTHGLAAMGGEQGLWSLPGITSTPAGKNKNLVIMDDAPLLGFGPQVVDAIDQLRNALDN